MNPPSPFQVGSPHLPTRREVKEKHFESVYNRYYRKIYGICRRYSSKPDEARDLTHDVFVRYFQNFEKFRHESSPSTWMYRVAINLGIHRWRRDRTRNQVDQELESIPDESPDTEIMLLDRITLKKILGRYPERMQRIFYMHHLEKMTQSEIGELLGISRSTVIRHLNHFKRSCQRQLRMDTVYSDS
jgi:RNA polymerase sigma-70 factor, ECF subfamily